MDRKIVLLIDNADSHFNTKRLEKENSDISSEGESDNEQGLTAHLQPMDTGIIHSFKSKYKQEFCKHLIWQFDSGIDYLKDKTMSLKKPFKTVESNDDDEIIDLLENLPEKDDVQEYFQLINYNVPTEENLKNEKSDSDDEEILPVSVKNAVSGLETFIKYFE
ncbi:9163_t:CDS:2 [Diversispora eburnea]|uniref:9163_t:CDS:1 n=1 Tax=Diversispora eburnea TaxID=1213867 RepID=A0A9N8VBR5_9GLOM|nr:9163_t:CDS:2 [Diversispora eburnea]